ncbi:hypothetical protein PGB90_004024 [Kerria lacca]
MFFLSRFKKPAYFSAFRCTNYFLVSNLSTENNVKITNAENKLIQLLKQRFSKANAIYVSDISGGCGAMYNVTVITPEFKYISLVQQHRMVTDVLKEEIKEMHGLRIFTSHEPIAENNS